ncbi:MAG: hypothetical protein GY834_07050 [Bacteroidetes bacterium]|nr:hypothetical protein [Bacteroidota bacterium]
MKNMNNILKWTLVCVLGLSVSFMYAQETKKHTTHIYTEKITCDKTNAWDTIIVITADNKDEIHEYFVSIEDCADLDINCKNIQLKHKSESKKDKNISSKSRIKVYHSGDNKVKGSENVFIYKFKEDSLRESHTADIHVIKEKLHGIGKKEHNMAFVVRGGDKKRSDVKWISKSGDDEMDVKVLVKTEGHHDKKNNVMVYSTKGGESNIERTSDGAHLKMLNHHFGEGDSLHISSNLNYVIKSDDGFFTIDSLGLEDIITHEISIDSKDKARLMLISENSVLHKGMNKLKFDVTEFVDESVIHLSKGDKDHDVMFYCDKDVIVEKFGLSMLNDLDEAELDRLSDLGIKSKNTKLKVEDVLLSSGEDSKLNIKFKLNTKGKTNIKLFNESGKELFSDKVQYFPGTYDKSMNISSEDDKGTFYLSVMQGNASSIIKLTIK